MGQILHRSATTMEAVRRAMRNSQENWEPSPSATGSTRRLSRSGSSVRPSLIARQAPKEAKSNRRWGDYRCFSAAYILPLDDCLSALQPTISHLTRSFCIAAFGATASADCRGQWDPTCCAVFYVSTR